MHKKLRNKSFWNSLDNFEKQILKVKVDGKWYWIDVTWGAPVPDRPGTLFRYDYFMISEEQMNRDHFPSK